MSGGWGELTGDCKWLINKTPKARSADFGSQPWIEGIFKYHHGFFFCHWFYFFQAADVPGDPNIVDDDVVVTSRHLHHLRLLLQLDVLQGLLASRPGKHNIKYFYSNLKYFHSLTCILLPSLLFGLGGRPPVSFSRSLLTRSGKSHWSWRTWTSQTEENIFNIATYITYSQSLSYLSVCSIAGALSCQASTERIALEY